MRILRLVKSGHSLNCHHVDATWAIVPCLIVPCSQNTNNLGIGDDEEFLIEYELVDVDFVFKILQEILLKRRKRVQ